jgi:ABC-2 type transport system ATP-binding protein
LSTHRADEAERCDRVIVIDEGRVIAQGTPQALQQQVSGDVISLQAQDPEALCDEIRTQLQLDARVIGGRVVLERERGHELVPRIVEALPKGRIEALSMHRPTLADVFVKLTGRSLGDTHTAGLKEAS